MHTIIRCRIELYIKHSDSNTNYPKNQNKMLYFINQTRELETLKKKYTKHFFDIDLKKFTFEQNLICFFLYPAKRQVVGYTHPNMGRPNSEYLPIVSYLNPWTICFTIRRQLLY